MTARVISKNSQTPKYYLWLKLINMTTNNISDISKLKNEMYEYIPPVNRLKMGNIVTNLIKNEGCNPRQTFYRIAGDNANLKVREIITTTPLRFKNKNGKTVKGVREVGKGVEGVVFLGCLDKKCKKQIAIKHGLTRDVAFEFKITKYIHNFSPHIVRPYSLSKECSDEKSFYYSEYQSGGDLLNWVEANHKYLKPIHFKVIVFQILYTLYRIQQRDPSFRHNDLHGGNVFVNDKYTAKGNVRYVINGVEYNVPNIGVSALVADFGYANTKDIKNPVLPNAELKATSGIAPDNHPMFDAHLFLNALWLLSVNKSTMKNIKNFIENILPPAYLGDKSKKISNFRLRFNASHTRLPSIADILQRPYFKTVFVSNAIRQPMSPVLKKIKRRAVGGKRRMTAKRQLSGL